MLTDPIERTGPAFADANGMRLCYEIFGKPADPPLVLVMGLAAQMIVWPDDFCAQLAAQGRRVIRFDNRDIGKSTHLTEPQTPTMVDVFTALAKGAPVPARYALIDMARDVVGLLDALGIDRADVVGASMGGAIAQELAIHFPERLRSVTMIMASSGDPSLPPPTPRAMAMLLKPRAVDRAAFVASYVETWQVLNADHFPFDEERTRREAEASFERGINPAGVVRQMMAIVASGNRTQALQGVRVPALVIHGSADPLVPAPAGRSIAQSIPDATLEIVEGMGHNLPRAAWPQMLGAIDRHAKSAA